MGKKYLNTKYILMDNNKKSNGGNGNIYFVQDETQKKYALKEVIFSNQKKYERFKREININQKIKDIDGILPIYDSQLLPGKKDSKKREKKLGKGWYTMDIGEKINVEDFSKKHTSEIVEDFLKLAKTLMELHKRGIVHRDIKPENLIIFNQRLYLIDFGLVNFPESTGITSEGERVGPWTTIAPEFKRKANISDGKKGDVYSFAKTLWILLTGIQSGFDGQYLYKDEELKLLKYRKEIDRNYFDESPLSVLEDFLMKATENDPNKRCTMEEAVEYLKKFLNANKREKIKYEWEFISKILFPYSTPNSAKWDNYKDIVRVLKEITYFKGLNHVFFESGGLDLTDITLSNEKGFVELYFDGIISKLKPKSLTFYSFDNSEWNYFLLETDGIKEKELQYKSSCYNDVELIELKPGKYIPSWCWEYKRNMLSPKKELLDNKARKINLYIKPTKVVIFAKASTYNSISSTYNGYQDILSNEMFRKIILWCQQHNPLNIFEGVRLAYHYLNNLEEYFRIKFNKKISKIKKEDKFPKYIYKFLTDSKMSSKNERLKNKLEKLKEKENKIITLEQEKDLLQEIENLIKTFQTTQEEILYQLSIIVNDKVFLILKNNSLQKEKDFSFLDKIEEQKLKVFNSNEVRAISLKLQEFSLKLGINKIRVYVKKMLFTKLPTYFPTKEELDKVLLSGDSFISNTLVCDLNGNIKLIPSMNKDEINLYPLSISDFAAYKNSVGEFYNENGVSLDFRYEQFLNYFYELLITKNRVTYVDCYKDDIEEKIKLLLSQ